MDFDSPEDVEKDFPGLYASEDGKSKKSKEDSDYSDGGEHDKVSKKELLIGRRKDKKDKGKDRGYAALEGESSPEEIDAKSPSKSKKSKAFKFSSSKSKEKREKSRDKEKGAGGGGGGGGDVKEEEPSSKPKEKEKEKEKPDKEQKEHKKKDKEHKKEKDKKEKSKEKDKDKKKLKQQPSGGGTSLGGVGGVVGAASEEVLELGDVQPVFGVSISLATERSRCHDGVDLPLVVRDCIDYLQEHALKSDHIYKVEPVRTRLQQYKRLYNNRERQPDSDELDTPTACGLLKLFLRELPEPVLTTDLIARFEEVAAQSVPNRQQQQAELQELLELLPSCNRELLAWILLHFDAVLQNESSNKMSSQSLAMLLSPSLQMSHRLLSLLCQHCTSLFDADLRLIKYVPPLTSSSPKLPDTSNNIQIELRKQESLLAQIHAEMNAGFVSKKREEQLWEVQRIITQLKRKLRSCEKRQDKSLEVISSATALPKTASTINGGGGDTIDATTRTNAGEQSKLSCSDDDESIKTGAGTTTMHTSTTTASESAAADTHADTKYTPQEETMMAAAATETEPEEKSTVASADNEETPEKEKAALEQDTGVLYFDEDSGLLMVPKTHQDYAQLVRLQLENRELVAWKTQLQTRIGAERAEILRLKQLEQQQVKVASKSSNIANDPAAAASVHVAAEDYNVADGDSDYEKIINHFIRENTLLEHKKLILAKDIFDEQRECIALQVELAMQQF